VPQLAESLAASTQTPLHRKRPMPQALPASGTDTEADGTQNPFTQAPGTAQSALVVHSSSELRPQPIAVAVPVASTAKAKTVLHEPAQRPLQAFIAPHTNVTVEAHTPANASFKRSRCRLQTRRLNPRRGMAGSAMR
jgi:hypothetical protein